MKAVKPLALIFALALFCFPACEIYEDDDLNPADPREKFLGNWKVNETCQRATYSVNVTTDPGNSAQVLIYNFGNTGPGYNPAIGLLVGSTVNVSSQTIGEDWTANGKGTYQSNGTILWTYTLVIGASQLECSATYFR